MNIKYTNPNNKIKKGLVIISLLILLSAPLSIGAAGLVPCGDDCDLCDLLILIQNVLDFALKTAFLIVIGFIVYGGFRWILSLGKEENLKAGQQIITNAIIGLIIILSAWVIVNTVFWAIKTMGGDDYTGSWFHIECPDSGSILNTPETPSAPVGPEEPSLPVDPDPEPQLITYKACYIHPQLLGNASCNTYTWSETGTKPNNECETDLICQELVYRSCSFDPQSQQSYCRSRIWSDENYAKPQNECERHSDCEIDFEAEEEAIEEGKFFVKTCYISPSDYVHQSTMSSQAKCITAEWIGTGTKPDNECEIDSECEILVYKHCGAGNHCYPRIWHNLLNLNVPMPDNECEIDSDCLSPSENDVSTPTSGTYKACRPSNWAWFSQNQTLYCKETDWTGEKPEDECSIIDEVCSEGVGAF